MAGLEGLNYSRTLFTLRALDVAALPSFLGSTLRGALGHALMDVVGDKERTDTERRALAGVCPYLYVFGEPELDRARRERDASRPFVLDTPPRRHLPWTPDEPLIFGLTLIGRAQLLLPWMVVAVAEMGEEGLGADRHPFRLEAVRAARSGADLWTPGAEVELAPVETGDDLAIAAPERVSLHLTTPAILMRNRRLVEAVPFEELVRIILRRLHAVMAPHCGSPLDVDGEALRSAAREVEVIEKSLAPVHVDRFTNRGQRTQRIEGLVGSVTYAGDSLPMFGPLLRAAEVLHVGKHCGMGFGQLRIDPAWTAQS